MQIYRSCAIVFYIYKHKMERLYMLKAKKQPFYV